MRKKIVLLLAAVLAAFTVQAPAAFAWQPKENAVFNVPKPWGTVKQRNTIINKVEAAINHAKPGSTILIATYLFDKRSSVNALIDACKRGVSTRVILDGHIDNKSSRTLIRALNGDNLNPDGSGHPHTGPCGRPLAGRLKAEAKPFTRQQVLASVEDPTAARPTWGSDQSYVKKCQRSCRGNGASMHGKFYAFSRTGKANNVVMVSSSNLNDGGAGRGWNDLYTFKERPAQFAGYERVHLEMTDENRVGRGQGPSYTVDEGPYTSRFFPWPGAGRHGDPVMKDLNKVRCHGPMGRTQIHVSQFWIKGARGSYIVNKLLSLAHHGCAVSFIYGAPSIDIATRLRNAAKHHLIALYDSRWDFNHNHEVDVRTHCKYVLVKGVFGADQHAYEVMTGTANWNPGSLEKGDENTLNINSAPAYNQYIHNWTTIRHHSRKLPYH